MGADRETALAALVAGLGLLAAVRALPPRDEPVGLDCPAESVGRTGGVASCRGPAQLGSGERRVLGLPIDVNVASADELEALPGVGAKLAARIVAERGAHGRFADLEDLTRVQGIGPGKLRLLAGHATVVAASRGAQPRYSGASP